MEYVSDGNFDSAHNAKITWVHLLQQSSEWQGTLWGKPDWADRYNGKARRPVLEPGSKYTYNDVRVNLAAFAALQVWRQTLPMVLRERIMDPIGRPRRGAGRATKFLGERRRRADESVAGGGHWGGGVWISARDHARFGLLHLRDGTWKGRRLLSSEWIRQATTSSPAFESYGFMWWLNRGPRRISANAPGAAFYAAGGGGNYVWVDKENDLVVVTRWIPDLSGIIDRVMAAMEPRAEGRTPNER